MSDRGTSPSLHSRTYHDASTHMDEHVRSQVFAHYLSLLDSMSNNIEKEVEQKSKEQQRPLGDVIRELAPPSEDLAQLRAIIGRMRHDISFNLDRWGEKWDIPWTPNTDASISRDVRFSMDILEESVQRMYGKDIHEFQLRWNGIDRKQHLGSKSPINIHDFIKLVYFCQLSNHVAPSLQNMMFLQLEHEFMQSLGMLLFHLNNYLNERGIRPVEHAKENTEASALQVERFPQTVNDETLFNTLCHLLQSWEPQAMEENNNLPSRPLTNTEIMATISTLQQWVPKVLEDALGQPDGRLAAHIKETMIKQAEALGVPEGKAVISEDDNEAVDLVDQVFTESLYARKIQAAARTVMAQILFPSVKAAILNRRWFSEDNHPARKFIHSVTELSVPRTGDVEQDMMNKASETVDKLVSGFNEDVSIFEILAQEIQEYLDQRKRLKEENFDAQAAAKAIRAELEAMWTTWKGPSPVKDFSIDLGTEYLVGLERVGERDSPRWLSALSVLHQFMQLRSSMQHRVKIDGLLRDGLMKMLTFCGWTGVRAHHRLAEQEDVIHAYYVLGQTKFETHKPLSMQEILDQELSGQTDAPPSNVVMASAGEREQTGAAMLAPTAEPTPVIHPQQDSGAAVTHEMNDLINQASSTTAQNTTQQVETQEIASTSQDATPHGVVAAEVTVSPLASNGANTQKSTEAAASVYNDSLLEKIMALEIESHSTWVNAQEEMVVVKLSWISPISMKFLFVNKNGARVLVGTPKELAEMANKGRFFPGATP